MSNVATVGIFRQNSVAGCLGYYAWSTVAPNSPEWFKDGVRGSNSTSFSAGWYRWSVNGTYSDITFSLYDVDYDEIDGNGGYNLVHGNVIRTYNENSFGGAWAGLFGTGWHAFYIKGDENSGIEDINVDVCGGEGIFSCLPIPIPVANPYKRAVWGEIKSSYKNRK